MKPKTNTFDIQQGSIGRDFKLSSTYIDNDILYHIFKYLDDNTFFAYYIENYKPRMLKHEEITDLLCTNLENTRRNFPIEQMTS